MGLFSGKTRVYVASSAYNLAGEESSRPNVLRSTVLGTVLSGTRKTIPDQLVKVLIKGPAGRQRNFFNWAKDNFLFGMPEATLGVDLPVDKDAVYSGVAPLIAVGANQKIRVISARIDDADIHYWAEAWVMANQPTLDQEAWGAEWDQAAQQIVVYLGDSEATRIAAPADLLWGASLEGRKLLFTSYAVMTTDPTTGSVSQSETRLHTYRMGSGVVALDTLSSTVPDAEFFPAIPLRISKTSVRNMFFTGAQSGALANIKKAYKKLTGARLDDLLDEIEKNENIGDVDSIYLVQGISLNAQENVSKAYLYKFLRRMMEMQYSVTAELPVLITNPSREEAQEAALWNRWLNAQATGATKDTTYQTQAPAGSQAMVQANPDFELRLNTKGLNNPSDYRLRWSRIEETTHLGNAKCFDGNQTRGRAKVGDYWLHVGPPIRQVTPMLYTTAEMTNPKTVTDLVPVLYLFHQYSARRYRKLTITNLRHVNYVYDNHTVTITAQEALEDLDESAFIVPLHYPTLISMGAARMTEVAGSANHLVFNSYKSVKQKWYQTGIFKVVLVIAAIAIAFIVPGGAATLGTTAGIFGTNAAVGLALGASAATAAIVGAVVNGIAAMVITTVISNVSTKIFGEKAGAIIATIASFVAISYGTQFATQGNFNVDWSSFMKAERLMDLTNAVGQAYASWLNADTRAMASSFEELERDYEAEMRKVDELSKEILGMTNGEIDPMMLTDATEHFGERSEDFLTRTLLTGTDIAELSYAMIENFVAISLEIPKAVLPSHT